jgi:hypothetical protein
MKPLPIVSVVQLRSIAKVIEGLSDYGPPNDRPRDDERREWPRVLRAAADVIERFGGSSPSPGMTISLETLSMKMDLLALEVIARSHSEEKNRVIDARATDALEAWAFFRGRAMAARLEGFELPNPFPERLDVGAPPDLDDLLGRPLNKPRSPTVRPKR